MLEKIGSVGDFTGAAVAVERSDLERYRPLSARGPNFWHGPGVQGQAFGATELPAVNFACTGNSFVAYRKLNNSFWESIQPLLILFAKIFLVCKGVIDSVARISSGSLCEECK